MADIAMLVAEEYERIMSSRRLDDEEEEEKLSFVSSVSIMVKRTGDHAWIRDNAEVLNRVFEPKSEISVAASHCLFSA
ncbi:hypothetical protein QQ045_027263 [Rhodiola kirilowii]